jgi:hypothetical protein
MCASRTLGSVRCLGVETRDSDSRTVGNPPVCLIATIANDSKWHRTVLAHSISCSKELGPVVVIVIVAVIVVVAQRQQNKYFGFIWLHINNIRAHCCYYSSVPLSSTTTEHVPPVNIHIVQQLLRDLEVVHSNTAASLFGNQSDPRDLHPSTLSLRSFKIALASTIPSWCGSSTNSHSCNPKVNTLSSAR